MKIQEIREIIKLIDQSTLDEFLYESEGTKIKIKRGDKNSPKSSVQTLESPSVSEGSKIEKMPSTTVNETPKPVEVESSVEKAAPIEVDNSSLHKITSPMVGTFYQSSSPESPAYVEVGSKVSSDSIVCIVEAMKLFNEIEAEVDGEIVEILVKDGQLVEYGQPLFLVKA